MKMSELSIDMLIDYLRLDRETALCEEEKTLEMILKAAKEYVKGHTGLSEEEIDTHEELPIAALILCEDMYDNRAILTAANTVQNKTVETILSLYSVNNLG